MKAPLVAIVGRPNVGKSSLFNRIIKKRRAIVEPSWGTTRDRVYSAFSWKDKSLELVDTGGLVLKSEERLKAQVQAQTERAIEEADALLFVCDAKDGPTPLDSDIAHLLRLSGKETLLVVNKADNEALVAGAAEFYRMGLKNPYPVSASSGAGIKELLDAVTQRVAAVWLKPPKITAKLALVGRPNVGKSSFLNALLEQERVIVDEQPGTTRDAVDTCLHKGEDHFILIDTAGIRRLKRIKEAVDVYSMARTRQAIERSDCCLLLIDATQGLTQDDVSIIGRITSLGRGIVLVANKWDLVKNITMEDYERSVRSRLSFAAYIPVLFASAKTRRNVVKALDMAESVVKNSSKRIATSALCRMLESAQQSQSHPVVNNKRVRFYYATQTSIQPPKFLIFANHPELVSQSYTRFLERKMRQMDDFTGVPIFINYRHKE